MTSVDLKMAALSLAVDARVESDQMVTVYEQAQAMYEWLMEGIEVKNPESEKMN